MYSKLEPLKTKKPIPLKRNTISCRVIDVRRCPLQTRTDCRWPEVGRTDRRWAVVKIPSCSYILIGNRGYKEYAQPRKYFISGRIVWRPAWPVADGIDFRWREVDRCYGSLRALCFYLFIIALAFHISDYAIFTYVCCHCAVQRTRSWWTECCVCFLNFFYDVTPTLVSLCMSVAWRVVDSDYQRENGEKMRWRFKIIWGRNHLRPRHLKLERRSSPLFPPYIVCLNSVRS